MGILVEKYDFERLCISLSNFSHAPLSVIKNKQHFYFLKEYLNELGTKTIIIEEEYVDRHYLDDYSSYYVKCFKTYNRFCQRIHFFNKHFNKDDFEAFLNNAKQSKLSDCILQDSYNGFMIVRPLPDAIFGKTCLKTYPSKEGNREFPAIDKYNISLCGIELSVDSLAYQEQDTVAGACATTALWTAFHKTGKLFNHKIKTPIEVTKDANIRSRSITRMIPSHGLTYEDMSDAIRSMGLEPCKINVINYNEGDSDKDILPIAIYSYLKMGIPCILGGPLIDTSYKKYKNLGRHAVTVVGYKLGKELSEPYTMTGIELTATKMDKIYVHDDQIGPFARMEIKRIKKFPYILLTTSWKSSKTVKLGSIFMVPEILLIPLYHKIRIPFVAKDYNTSFLDKIIHFDAALEALRILSDKIQKRQHKRIEWELCLSFCNTVKKELKEFNGKLEKHYKTEILEHSMPRFLWRAIAHIESPQFELLFDATDIERSNYYFKSIIYNPELLENISDLNRITDINTILPSLFPQAWPALDLFLKELEDLN